MSHLTRVSAGAGFAIGLAGLMFLAGGHRPIAAQPKAPPITPAPQAPTLTTPVTLGAKPGEAVELTLTGTNLAEPVAVVLSCPGRASIPTDNKNGTDPAKLRVKVELPPDCPIGLHTIRVITRQGVSNFRPFLVDELPTTAELETNRSKDTAQVISVPGVVTGRTDAEASDFFKLKVAAGQTLTFEVLARRIGSPLDPIVVLHDAKTKRELVDLYADDTPGLQSDCRLTHTFKEAGEYLVEVRDTTYRGGPDFFYRLRIGEFPAATTAFPLAIERGKRAMVGFAGPGTADLPPISVKASTNPGRTAMSVAPRRATGVAGWPLPVLLSDHPELIEQEPNNELAQANRLPVPGGMSAKFEKSGDVDHFVVAGQKGQKLVAIARTYEVNSPAEVLLRVLDAKGGEIARSNPAQPAARVEFTPPADGDFIIACEHLNYLSGPNEIYHLVVEPVQPDFSITLATDRYEAAPGGGTAVLVTVNRLNGYDGPVQLSIVGHDALSGTVTLPPGQSIAFVPLVVDVETHPGVLPFRVQGRATVAGQERIRFGTLLDPVKAALNGIPNPPPELLTGCVVAVIDKPAFRLELTAEAERLEKGKTGKILIDAVRGDGFDGDITIAPLFVPPNVTPVAKPIPKGQTKGEFGLTVTPAAAVGPTPVVLRATAKVGGKDVAFTLPPVIVEVVEPKKAEPKKDEPKKVEKK
jgi:hypothetical protein